MGNSINVNEIKKRNANNDSTLLLISTNIIDTQNQQRLQDAILAKINKRGTFLKERKSPSSGYIGSVHLMKKLKENSESDEGTTLFSFYYNMLSMSNDSSISSSSSSSSSSNILLICFLVDIVSSDLDLFR